MLKVQEIREIIKLVDQSSLNEFTYETNGTKVSMKKLPEGVAVQANPVVHVEKEISPVAVEKQPVQAVKEEIVEKQEVSVQSNSVDYDHEITSPMVGTFYSSPSPDSEPFVSIGSSVSKETVVCIVEAMKLFNEIEAEVSGEIVEVLVENGELVEYGQPLFRVKTK
ncbi:acetyl-CoA carboxylase biotin carboxyl carrier protein [Ornithinibacillus bavariensis]|uniref:Biotin carboxyl carrier protein of acetyl-CoA carboxylase n=1 Tax=Ornithinibacillus bavariensis TaxID=545502 RepID=A0A920C8S9_9BACI|nr:acetyl-CoA carboxylase biotin carboxyl carrier protein [Ornithinibacillus bavariensis]GIO28554.1 acetyl-CoA carboxylase, biotin carboxyl carrier protein [Ornithinibacillus bavariensis]HAM80274.1 acetyl-CoA carboxylase biotin carboxyl carrier protein [Ornithinibacillus sp.]